MIEIEAGAGQEVKMEKMMSIRSHYSTINFTIKTRTEVF